MTFTELKLIKPLLTALDKKGYKEPSPIQEKSIPHILLGKDIFGCAQTGTGKTAAFALPILQLLDANKKPNQRREIKALILAPTRELATQISENFKEYGANLGFKHAVIFGGVSQFHQVVAIKSGIDILIFDRAGDTYKLVRENRPVVLEKKMLHSKRAGDTAQIEYKFSDTEFSHKLHVYKETDSGDWDEISTESLGL